MQAKKDEKLLKRRNIAPEAELPPLADANQQKVTLFTGVSTMGRGTDILCTVLIRWDKGEGRTKIERSKRPKTEAVSTATYRPNLWTVLSVGIVDSAMVDKARQCSCNVV